MFKEKTLFVVGAGASKEAGLPTGNELKASIANKVALQSDPRTQVLKGGDAVILHAVQVHVANSNGNGDVNHYVEKCWHIHDAMPLAVSIDNFLDNHQGDDALELCGKLGIAKAILEAERNSSLFVDNTQPDARLNFERVKETWYTSFNQLLTVDCHKRNIINLFHDVSFITFNYDRCIEHFLFNALQTNYGIDAEEAASVMGLLQIFHPYGVVGDLPWQNGETRVEFGAKVTDGAKLLSLAGRIRTFTERIQERSALERMRELVADAKVIVFLGFGFHQQNMKLLRTERPRSPRLVLGTTKGFSEGDSAIIQAKLAYDLQPSNNRSSDVDIRFGAVTCSDLLWENRVRLEGR